LSAVDRPHASAPPARWGMIEGLFTRALDLPPAKRDEFLAAACPDDDELRQEVRNLLAAHDAVIAQGGTDDRFLERLDAARAAALIEPGAVTDLPEHLQRALGTTYRVERQLSRGGMSRVFVAEQPELGRRVVVKVLPPDLAGSVSIERFQREVRLAARLQHPHIVPLLSAGEAEGLLYYTMPLVEGESLHAKLAREGALPVEECVRILRDVVDALTYAHSHGVAHRDIKPDNVLIAGRHAVVTDFGVAKALAEASAEAPLTASGLILGTPAYMAPEQAAGDRHVDHRADIYAVGALAYEMLAGCPPFVRATTQALLAAHMAEPPQPVMAHRAHVPPSLAELVMRCLEKHPADRWQTAEEVLARLQKLTVPGTDESQARQVASARGRGRYVVVAVLVTSVLAIAGGAYLVTRAAKGSGRISLFAAGTLDPSDRILIADFANRSRDTSLGPVVTEALRVDLAQSRAVRALPPERVREALRRMQQPTDVPLDPALAREVALREGIKAIVIGEIGMAGPRYLLSVHLTAPETGEVLTAVRETAEDSTAIIGAVDRLSKGLRRRIGEPLRAVRASPPLARVTTGSLAALRKYSQASRALAAGGRNSEAITLLEEAIAIDTAFAMAYGDLGLALHNLGGDRTRVASVLTKALQYQDRLTERERYATLAAYHNQVTGDWEKTIAALRAALDLDPQDGRALRDMGWTYRAIGELARSEEFYLRALEIDSSAGIAWLNLIHVQVALGKLQEARESLRRMAGQLPDNPTVAELSAQLAVAGGDHEAAEVMLRTLKQRRPESAVARERLSVALAELALMRGRIAEAERQLREAIAAAAGRGDAGPVIGASHLAHANAALRRAPARARHILDSTLARHPLVAIPNSDRPYLELAEAFAVAGNPGRARALLAEFDTVVNAMHRRLMQARRHEVSATVLLAEAQPRLAVTEFRLAQQDRCPFCALAGLGLAHDLVGEADSAITIYERYLAMPSLWRVGVPFTLAIREVFSITPDARYRGPVLKRLGELYEARGDREKAAHYYTMLVELWKDADPELQRTVREVRRRLERLGRDDDASPTVRVPIDRPNP
jgi:tetratricopeptide (TPR) repeat protein/tRNA A-37 threonylcarbamoyl transferase component Bud32